MLQCFCESSDLFVREVHTSHPRPLPFSCPDIPPSAAAAWCFQIRLCSTFPLPVDALHCIQLPFQPKMIIPPITIRHQNKYGQSCLSLNPKVHHLSSVVGEGKPLWTEQARLTRVRVAAFQVSFICPVCWQNPATGSPPGFLQGELRGSEPAGDVQSALQCAATW